jgi:hypothetical protein
VCGAVAVWTSNPSQADLQTLLHDVRAGRVDRVEIISDGGTSAREARWSTGPLRWWQADITDSAFPSISGGPPGRKVDLSATLQRQAAAAHHPLRIVTRHSRALWTMNLPWAPLGTVATVVWVLTFLTMLTNPANRYANRWAWFWLFTSGLAGAMFYLALENRPLWSRGPTPEPTSRMRGGTGFVAAIGLSIAVSLLGIGVHWAFGAAPRWYSGLLIEPVFVRE